MSLPDSLYHHMHMRRLPRCLSLLQPPHTAWWSPPLPSTLDGSNHSRAFTPVRRQVFSLLNHTTASLNIRLISARPGSRAAFKVQPRFETWWKNIPLRSWVCRFPCFYDTVCMQANKMHHITPQLDSLYRLTNWCFVWKGHCKLVLLPHHYLLCEWRNQVVGVGIFPQHH